MRLALGFCGQFAKTTFSALSVKKLEVGHLIEVRRVVFELGGCKRDDALLSLFSTALVCSERFHAV